MKIIIDTNEIKDKGVSVDTLLYLLSLYLKNPITVRTFETSHDRGFTILRDNEASPYSLDGAGANIVERVFLDSEIPGNSQKPGRYEKLADRLRALYPAGRKPGTNYMWRDSTVIIAKKLKGLVKKYGDCFTDEQAVEATRKYIESFNGDYSYMQLLKYFISKRKLIDGEIEETSQLLSFIQNGDQESITDNWNTELK